ncbi:hypothetical protein FB451DRAFT_1556528 [Mycena latifolia]|nr:hypothetical protein FB451DRAFT_1556528 [Mycena latifolia]
MLAIAAAVTSQRIHACAVAPSRSPTTSSQARMELGWIEQWAMLLILEAARRGLIPPVTGRLVDAKRRLIASGSVIVSDERAGVIKASGSFLFNTPVPRSWCADSRALFPDRLNLPPLGHSHCLHAAPPALEPRLISLVSLVSSLAFASHIIEPTQAPAGPPEPPNPCPFCVPRRLSPTLVHHPFATDILRILHPLIFAEYSSF